MKRNIPQIRLLLPLYLSLAIIIGILLGYKLKPSLILYDGHSNIINHQNKLTQIYQYVLNEYVDSLSSKQVVQSGIEGILSSLDPHSTYIPAEFFHEVNDPLMGEFEGIGVQFRIVKDSVVIIQVIKSGPSEKVGLMAGDRIVKVNDSLLIGETLTNETVIKQLKGEKGTTVNISVFRRGIDDLLDFTIVRDIIPTFSIDAAFEYSKDIGYIKMSTFSSTTYDEMVKALTTFKNDNIKNLILDLRGNGGGRLKAAVDIANEFLNEGQLIVFTEGFHRSKKEYFASSDGLWKDQGLILLIDENSASSSEILAGAIQDNDRGIVIGRRSFGKGLVQEQLHFPDGSAIRLTIAKYYTPTGRSIQKPYNAEEGFDSYYMEYFHRDTVSIDSVNIDTTKYITPAGKILYGGGGIQADSVVKIPIDDYPYYYSLINKGLIFRFTFQFTDKNRKRLETYKTADIFISDFEITNEIMDEFDQFIKSKIDLNKFSVSEKTQSKEKISNLLKAYIGRNLFDYEAFYPIYLQQDEVYLKAVNVFSNQN